GATSHCASLTAGSGTPIWETIPAEFGSKQVTSRLCLLQSHIYLKIKIQHITREKTII
ncbi:hypothetical protein XENORESO_012821, partial [Xenotaenia resolanae]